MKTSSLRTIWALALFAAFAAPAHSAGELRPFDAKSLAVIRQEHAGKPFVLALWSITCAPCKEEMVVLAAFQKKYPQVPIVLVATDPPSTKSAVVRYLAAQKLGRMETWTFADEFAERVRFAVDPKWRGELPRTYFFDAQHQATAHTGLLDPAWVNSWLANASAAIPKADTVTTKP